MKKGFEYGKQRCTAYPRYVVQRTLFDQFLAMGGSRTRVATMIYTSPESDADLVDGWYRAFLHRPADASGLNGFVTALMLGARDESLLANIIGSDEYMARL